MKALVLRGEWDPRPGYPVTPQEERGGKARVASQVWRHTHADWEDIPDPELAPDEVRIQVRACGVCGSDTHCVEMDPDGYMLFSGPTALPTVFGHEYSGTVVEVGRDVKTLQVGDPVAAEGMLWCGLCPPCRAGHPNQCHHLEMVGFSAPGAFATHIATRERYCWSLAPLMEQLDQTRAYELGALLEPAGCSFNGLYVVGGGITPGATCAIHGAGPIGLAAIPIARAGGATKIWIFDTVPERVALARKFGADGAYVVGDLHAQGTTPHEVLLDATGGVGADVHIEAAGAANHTFPEIEQSLAPTGKAIYLGRTGEHARIHADVMVTGANSLVGSRGHAGHNIYPSLIRLAAAGMLDLLPMITSHFELDDTLEALEQSRTRADGKIMITY